MKSDTLQINQLKNSLKNIRDDSDILFKETRDFMFSLNSKSDYLEEVVTYISDFGEDFYQSFKIDFYIEKNINQKFKLPYYWNRQIILIFKEAMTNVAKHSNASEVYFIIIQDKNQLKMSLKDNGQGFDFENIKTKNGLKNIIQRAQKIGAEIDFMNNKDSFEVQFKAVIK